MPKPLVRFFGAPLLELAFFRLHRASIKDVAANAHYLANTIESHIKASRWGKSVHLSVELPEILGRGGAFLPLRQWFGSRTIIAINGDIIGNMDLNGALDSHRRSGAIATMMVLPAPLGRDNAVYCDGLMQIGAIAKSPPQFAGSMDTWTARGFACVQIIEPEFLDLLPPIGPSDILEAYGHAIKHGMKLNSFIHDGFWHDLGSPAQLFQAHREVLELPEATAKKLLDELGVFAFAQAEGNDCLFVPSGSVWNSPGGKIEIIGPALLSRFNSESLTDWEKRLTSPVSMGPMVAAEAGFSVTDSCSIANAIIFSSAKLSRAVTTQTGHMATIHDHNHVIKIHQT